MAYNIYMRFQRWSENGLFWRLLRMLQQKKKIKMDLAWIDSPTIALHRHGSGSLKKGPQSLGRGRRGMSTKMHIGLSTNYLHGTCLSEGERVDMKVFPTLWASGDWQDGNFVVADKGYDVYQVLKLIRDTGKAVYYSQASKCSF